MGITFKENCPDLRNSRVLDVFQELAEYNLVIDAFDPWVDAIAAQHNFGIVPIAEPKEGIYDAVIVAVAHKQFIEMGPEKIRALGKPQHILYDLKYVLPPGYSDLRL